MKTRCPKCHTRYEIDLDALLAADGMARCFRCSTVFNALVEEVRAPEAAEDQHRYHPLTIDEQSDTTEAYIDDAEFPGAYIPEAVTPGPFTPPPFVPGPNTQEIVDAETDEVTASTATDDHDTVVADTDAFGADTMNAVIFDSATAGVEGAEEASEIAGEEGHATDVEVSAALEADQEQADESLTGTPEAERESLEPPFDVPDDLEPLKAAEGAEGDVLDTLYERRPYRGLLYGSLALLLLAGLGLQLAWQFRLELLDRYPMLEPLCERIECRPSVVHAPQEFRVLERRLVPTPDKPDSLSLSLRFRNEARIAQRFPDIQLSLLNSNGAVLIRRLLTPSEYLFPAHAESGLVEPGEVVTIDLDFKDPGNLATGFEIDFF